MKDLWRCLESYLSEMSLSWRTFLLTADVPHMFAIVVLASHSGYFATSDICLLIYIEKILNNSIEIFLHNISKIFFMELIQKILNNLTRFIIRNFPIFFYPELIDLFSWSNLSCLQYRKFCNRSSDMCGSKYAAFV